ncbi:N-acetyltransferase-like protein [Zalerion maritima]|uniref:N-acetyltransferase-like protein n=1 Tax=Zalerion maritima TaxID=339359 RepID=A0AAD5RVL6_9PEZI|nr:N-acetyltransferase-like protein [Zalerion maritima]
MGSTISPPPSGSTELYLTHPTEEEKKQIWASTHPLWGTALSREVYVKREAYLQTIPVAKTGGMSNWVLTTSPTPSENRLVLSSCESLRKRAFVSTTKEDGTVELKESTAHGIASVFNDPAFRGRGYASRMMKDLALALSNHKGSPNPNGPSSPTSSKRSSYEGPESICSILYSDIGKSFYSKHGWKPFPSEHVSFRPSTAYVDTSNEAKPLSYHDLAILSAADEEMLRKRLSSPSGSRKKTRIAIVPDLDSMLWHLMREDYMTTQLFSRVPTVRGAMVGLQEAGNRVWAIWTRNYYSPDRKDMHKNTFYILRFVVEDETMPGDQLVDATRKIVNMAKKEAAEWHLGEVQMWNPAPVVRRAIEGTKMECSWTDREDDSIASLNWYGSGDAEDVEWVANEKFAWC